jgi:hypothetical protein
MKEFYVDKLSLEFVSEQRDRHIFLKTDKNMGVLGSLILESLEDVVLVNRLDIILTNPQ